MSVPVTRLCDVITVRISARRLSNHCDSSSENHLYNAVSTSLSSLSRYSLSLLFVFYVGVTYFSSINRKTLCSMWGHENISCGNKITVLRSRLANQSNWYFCPITISCLFKNKILSLFFSHLSTYLSFRAHLGQPKNIFHLFVSKIWPKPCDLCIALSLF